MSLQYVCGELAMSVLLLLLYLPLGVCVVYGVLCPCQVSLYVLWVHCVFVCAYHVCLCYLPFVYCTWLECPCGVMCLHVCVFVCVLLLLLSWVR